MNIEKLIDDILEEMFDGIRRNKGIRRKTKRIIDQHVADPTPQPKKPRRRKSGPLDPMAIHRDMPAELEQQLGELQVEELKDIIAEHGMDRWKLAMKWKSRERLIELITSTVKSQSQKGDTFWNLDSRTSNDD